MKMRSTMILLLVSALVAPRAAQAETKEKTVAKGGGSNRTLGTPNATYLNINKISTYLRADGRADLDVTSNNSGLVYPKGSSKTAIFQSGFLWGARVQGDPQVRVGGSAYRTGLQTGKLLSPGVSEDPNLPKNRIYRVRPDWRNADLSSEVRDEGRSAAEVRAQYERDWNEWPATDGAPYKDVDSNHAYNPSVDIAGVPGADQTVWFVCNDNNSTNTQNLYGALPMGIEVQYTIWAYAQEGALGNMIFKSYTMINKGTSQLDSMYVCQWSDPDLGNAADDFVGCDTSLSIGFVYNAGNTDATYNPLPPPASGFDFFQGPIVPSAGSQAIFRGRVKDGYRNLPMTAFFYFINQDPTLTDPTQGAIAGSSQFYNFFRGRIGLTGQLFQDPQGNPTTFTLTGDPQSGRGWLDGQQFPAGDRRMGLASGPFAMAPGDTQEIVVAEIAAGAIPGVDRLSAVGLLKFFDRAAQLAYDNFFQLPSPPPLPKVTVTELNNSIVLNWGNDLNAVKATETSNTRGFRFQGYNVYQLPSASATITEAKKIATFDIPGDGVTRITDQVFDPETGVVTGKVVQLGTDSGIKRYLQIRNDALNGGTPLINGIRYYFAVTAYSFNPDPNSVPNNIEDPLQIITVVPHSENPGIRMPLSYGDTASVDHAGRSDGAAVPFIVDPSRTTGKSYKVIFRNIPETFVYGPDSNGDRDTVTTDIMYWYLVSGADTLYRSNNLGTAIAFDPGTHNLAEDFPATFGDEFSYPVIDGMFMSVSGPAPQLNAARSRYVSGTDWTSAGGAGRFTGSPSLFSSQVTAATNVGTYLGSTGAGAPAAQFTDVEFRFGNNGSLTQKAYRYRRMGTPNNYRFQDYTNVPFQVWDVSGTTPRQLNVGYRDNDNSGAWEPSGALEILFVATSTYDGDNPTTFTYGTTVGSDANSIPLGDFQLLAEWVSANGVAADIQESKILVSPNRVLTVNDSYTFTAPAPTQNLQTAKNDVSQINVFPNPYYGVNTEEINKYQRFVTFNHLPDNAIIRIFNLAGVQIREIRKDASTSPGQFMRWDLANESGLPVGSGLYIAHIEMPDLGASKVLKLAIVQEQQILDRF